MIAQAVMFGFRIGEISCPTKYFEEASSINFKRSVEYGLGVLGTTITFAAQARPDTSGSVRCQGQESYPPELLGICTPRLTLLGDDHETTANPWSLFCS